MHAQHLEASLTSCAALLSVVVSILTGLLQHPSNFITINAVEAFPLDDFSPEVREYDYSQSRELRSSTCRPSDLDCKKRNEWQMAAVQRPRRVSYNDRKLQNCADDLLFSRSSCRSRGV